MRNLETILIIAAVVLPPGLVLGACGDPASPLWEDAGERQEPVTALVLGGPVTETDTLPVVATGFATAGRPSGCRWEIAQTTHQADLTLWVRTERWVGASDPPPYDLQFHCPFLIVPPLSAGVFRVILHQADGSTLTDSVTVSPAGSAVAQ